MTRIKMHISKVKLPFYPPCEVKCGLQNRVSTAVYGIMGGLSNIFLLGFFLFSPIDAVIVWGTGTLFVLIVCTVLLVLYIRSANWVMPKFSRLSL